ncbi:MAG: hypothetical protein AAGA58_07160 [Verrucomicrobiota bacterium]
MKSSTPLFVLKVITATLTGVYVFEHPRAWAGNLPDVSAPIVETVEISE